LKKFSLTGGDGLSVLNHAKCGMKTYLKDVVGYRLKKVAAELAVGNCVHDALAFVSADPFGDRTDQAKKSIAETILSGKMPLRHGYSMEIEFKGMTPEETVEMALELFDRASSFPICIRSESEVELKIEVPLTDPETGEVFFQDQVMVCGTIDMLESFPVRQENYYSEPSYRNNGKMICINADTGEKPVYKSASEIERENFGEIAFKMSSIGEKKLIVTDWKTAAFANKHMDNHLLQTVGMYPYLYFIKEGKMIDYASIIEIPKSKSGECVRHMFPASFDNVIHAFRFVKKQIISILNEEYVPNYDACSNFYRCSYFEQCHHGLFEDSEKIAKEKFRIAGEI